MTSLVDLGLPVTLADVDLALRRSFGAVFSQQAATVARLSNQPLQIWREPYPAAGACPLRHFNPRKTSISAFAL